MTTIGLIGAGMLGAPVGTAIARAGIAVRVYDRDPARARSVKGASNAPDAEAAAEGADAVLCCVDGPDAALAVALGRGDGGLAARLDPDQVYVELTTMSLDAVRAEAAAFAERGVGFLEAPLSGRPPNLTALLGGDPECSRRLDSVLGAFTDHRWYLGDVGAGTVAKLVNQYLTYANLVVAAEGLSVAAAYGVPTDLLADALTTCAGASRSLALVASVLSDGAAGYSPAAAILRDLELFAALDGDATRASPMLDELRAVLATTARDDPTTPFPHLLAGYGLQVT